MPINIKTNAKKISSVLLATALLSFSAPMPARSENVGPFGFDVGKDKFEDIKDRLDDCGCDYSKTTAITSGKIAVCKTALFDPTWGKSDVLFIFSNDDTLEAISIKNFNLTPYKIVATLSWKYTADYLAETSRFRSGNVTIDFNSNSSELLYFTDAFGQKTERYQKKIKQKEYEAQKQLRLQNKKENNENDDNNKMETFRGNFYRSL